MEEDCKALTAFTVTPLGFYEFNRMSLWLTTELQNHIIYLDIIIFSNMPKGHLDRLRAVFERLKEASLKLKPSKCEFFKQKLMYLDHVVSGQGIQTDPKKVAAIWK